MNTSPVYLQIADKLRQQIRDGRYKPGDALPSTTELQQAMGVSQTTVRNAVALLRAEGLLDVPGPGRPTTVRVPPTRIIRDGSSRYQYEKDMALRGGLPRDTHLAREVGAADTDATVELISEELVTSTGDIGYVLGLEPHELVHRYSFRIGVRGTTVGRLAHHYFPEDLDAAVREAQPDNAVNPGSVIWPGGTMYQLALRGIEAAYVVDQVTARMPLPEEAQLLGLPEGVPLLCVRKVTYDTAGVAREVADVIMPGDRSRGDYRVELMPWPARFAPFPFDDSDVD